MGDAPFLFASNPKIKPFRKSEGMWARKAEQDYRLQMHYSIETLEADLARQGDPHLLMLVESTALDTVWSLYADGKLVLEGHYEWALDAFTRSSREFYTRCQRAVKEADLAKMNPHDYYLLKAANEMAKIIARETLREQKKKDTLHQR